MIDICFHCWLFFSEVEEKRWFTLSKYLILVPCPALFSIYVCNFSYNTVQYIHYIHSRVVLLLGVLYEIPASGQIIAFAEPRDGYRAEIEPGAVLVPGALTTEPRRAFFSRFWRDSSAAFSWGYSSTNLGVDPVGLFIHLGWTHWPGIETDDTWKNSRIRNTRKHYT